MKTYMTIEEVARSLSRRCGGCGKKAGSRQLSRSAGVWFGTRLKFWPGSNATGSRPGLRGEYPTEGHAGRQGPLPGAHQSEWPGGRFSDVRPQV
jgi:hypothetical protein